MPPWVPAGSRMVVLAVPLETAAVTGSPIIDVPLIRMNVTVPGAGLDGAAGDAGSEGHRLGGVGVVGRRRAGGHDVVAAPGGLAAERNGVSIHRRQAGVADVVILASICVGSSYPSSCWSG